MALEDFDLKKIGLIAVAIIIVLGGAYFLLGFGGQAPSQGSQLKRVQQTEPLTLEPPAPGMVPEPFISTGDPLLDCVDQFYRREKADKCKDVDEAVCKAVANDWCIYCASAYDKEFERPPVNEELDEELIPIFCGLV